MEMKKNNKRKNEKRGDAVFCPQVPVTMMCRTAIRAHFLYFNLFLKVMLESIYGHLHSYSSLLNLNVFYCNDHNDIRYVFRSFTLILFSSKRYIRDCEL